MSVYLLYEWTTSKDEERDKKRLKHEAEFMFPYVMKKKKEGVKWDVLGLADGAGKIVALVTFDSVDDFDKIWNDDEYKKGMVRMAYFVDDFTCRLLRGII